MGVKQIQRIFLLRTVGVIVGLLRGSMIINLLFWPMGCPMLDGSKWARKLPLITQLMGRAHILGQSEYMQCLHMDSGGVNIVSLDFY